MLGTGLQENITIEFRIPVYLYIVRLALFNYENSAIKTKRILLYKISGIPTQL